MKRKPLTKQSPEGGSANWLTTFNDLVTLLMVFFVLLFSMSTIDTGKMKSFQESLQTGLGMLEAGEAGTVGVFDESRLAVPDDIEAAGQGPAPEASGEQPPGKGDDPVQSAMATMDALAGVSVIREDRALRIRVEGELLFALGRADISTAGRVALDRLTPTLGAMAGKIRVEGHTDNVPIQTTLFPSNWELSTARSVNVVKFLTSRGKIAPQRLSAVGYGDSKPLDDNETPQGRTRNRRVEIVLELEEESQHV